MEVLKQQIIYRVNVCTALVAVYICIITFISLGIGITDRSSPALMPLIVTLIHGYILAPILIGFGCWINYKLVVILP